MFSFRKWWHYCWGTIVRPTTMLRQLAGEASIRYAFAAMLLFSVGFSLSALLHYLGGGTPSLLWVSIPPNQFYLWLAFYGIPLYLELWIVFAAFAHLFSRLQHGIGSFEATVTVLRFTFAIPFFVLFWIPDLVLFHIFNMSEQVMGILTPIYGSASFVWMLLLSAVGLKITHQLSFPRALLTAIGAFVTLAWGTLLIRQWHAGTYFLK